MAEAKKRPLSALERARQQAAAQAEAFARREKELTGLAVDYLMAGSTLERALEQIERRMEPLRREQRDAEEAAQRARVEAVARMRALEASEAEVAARLGISLGEVRRSMALSRSWGSGGDGPAGEQPGSATDEAPDEEGMGAVFVEVPPLPGVPPEPGQVPGLDGWEGPWNEPEPLR